MTRMLMWICILLLILDVSHNKHVSVQLQMGKVESTSSFILEMDIDEDDIHVTNVVHKGKENSVKKNKSMFCVDIDDVTIQCETFKIEEKVGSDNSTIVIVLVFIFLFVLSIIFLALCCYAKDGHFAHFRTKIGDYFNHYRKKPFGHENQNFEMNTYHVIEDEK